MEHIEVIAQEIHASVAELAHNQIAIAKAVDTALAAAMEVVLAEYVEIVGTEPNQSFVKGMEAFTAQALHPRMQALIEKAGEDAVAHTQSSVWEKAGEDLAASMLLPTLRMKLQSTVRERDRRISAEDARASSVKAIDVVLHGNVPTPAPASYDPAIHMDGAAKALAKIDQLERLAKQYPSKKRQK